ncbi:MAG: cytochrome c [Gammaproteobacteria bacterium]|nr:cytochrome c [Gammaproteobacteria bacterium]
MSMFKRFYIVSIMMFFLLTAGASLAADAVAGKEKSLLCSGCHGANGISSTPDMPNLASQKEAYLVKAIKDYREGSRKNPMMNSIAQGLSDDDIANLAAYFSSLSYEVVQ